MRQRCEPDSNDRQSRGVAVGRADPSITSTEAGIQNALNDEQPRNTFVSIHASLEQDSNLRPASDLHLVKQESRRISTGHGRQIFFSDSPSANAVGVMPERFAVALKQVAVLLESFFSDQLDFLFPALDESLKHSGRDRGSWLTV
jgi:hypothetical protein